ncbi:MAG: radical SAM protein [Methanospirillum sp.]|nr:radical SAM protein [Methanospirillum sp.]
MTSSAVLLDGYVDEPACLGVPPYLAPEVRQVAGVLYGRGYGVRYLTIDQLRADPLLLGVLERADLVVVHAGTTVPGKYLAGTPAGRDELSQLGRQLQAPTTALGGPVLLGSSPIAGGRAPPAGLDRYDLLLSGHPAAALDAALGGGEPRGSFDYTVTDPFAVAGAAMLPQHPSFPHVVCELETARGCARQAAGGCSFCTEPMYGPPRYRPTAAVGQEVAALAATGARHFRLGRQPDILAYGSPPGPDPVPDPDRIGALFASVRAGAPDLLTLHIDNVNPITIARHEEASRAALERIVAMHTPGDVAAFGMETADPVVIARNNLKASPDQVFRAIRVVNEVGGGRRNGIPELLPGLNFVSGLAGETAATFDLNIAFLRRVLAANLLVRRINLRWLMPFPGTRAHAENTLGTHDREFRAFKAAVRQEIDRPMLERVFPVGCVVRHAVVERSGTLSLARPLGSYPILLGLPLRLPPGTVLDAVVVDHGQRSVTALPYPVPVNTLPLAALRWLPGVGKRRAAAIAARRPFRSLEVWRGVVGQTPIDGQLDLS